MRPVLLCVRCLSCSRCPSRLSGCVFGVPVCLVWGRVLGGLPGRARYWVRAVYLVCTAIVRCYCGRVRFVSAVHCYAVCGFFCCFAFFHCFGASRFGGLFHYPPNLLLMMAITGIFLMGACVLALAACLVLLTRWIAHRAGMPADEMAVLVTAAVFVLILLGVALSPAFR